MTNPWSCLLDAFAIALDIPAGLIEKYIEHDGGEIIWPTLKEPLCRQSFHIQELIDFCVDNNYMVTEIIAIPTSIPIRKVIPFYIYNNEYCCERLNKYLSKYNGVLIGVNKNNNRHAIAWINDKVIDPANVIKTVEEFSIESFFLIQKIKSNGKIILTTL